MWTSPRVIHLEIRPVSRWWLCADAWKHGLMLTCMNSTGYSVVQLSQHVIFELLSPFSVSVRFTFRYHLTFHDKKKHAVCVVCVSQMVCCSDSCLRSIWGDFTPSSAVCCFEKKLISFQSHLLLYSLTVSLLCSFLFCKSNRISVFLSTPAIQKLDCFVHLHQNTEESSAIHLCSKVWNHLVSLSLC